MTTTVRDRSVTFDGVTYLTAPVVAPLVGGTFHVHAAGCGDLRKSAYREARESGELDAPWETRSLSDLVEGVYRYGGSFYQEQGLDPDDDEAWRLFAGEFKVYPCITLPDTPKEV